MLIVATTMLSAHERTVIVWPMSLVAATTLGSCYETVSAPGLTLGIDTTDSLKAVFSHGSSMYNPVQISYK